LVKVRRWRQPCGPMLILKKGVFKKKKKREDMQRKSALGYPVAQQAPPMHRKKTPVPAFSAIRTDEKRKGNGVSNCQDETKKIEGTPTLEPRRGRKNKGFRKKKKHKTKKAKPGKKKKFRKGKIDMGDC